MSKIVLGDICEFINGGAWSDKEYVSYGIPVLKVTNCKPQGFQIDDINYLAFEAESKYNKNRLFLDDVIIATVGSHPSMVDSAAGRTCVVTSLVEGFYLNQNAVCLRTKDQNFLDQRYLGYLCKSRDFQHYIQNKGRGAANQMRIAIGSIKEYYFELPPLTIQKKIADILSAYDDLIENNQKQIKLLEEAAQRLYKEWFVRFRFPGYEKVKFENGLPEGWNYVRFGKAIEIIDGDRGVNYPKQEEFYPEGDCLFLNTGNVTAKGFDFSNCAYITKEKDAILRKGKLQHNDVVLTTRGTVGNAAFYNETMTFSEMRINSGMVILRNLGMVSPEYIYTALRHERLQKIMTLYASGSAQPQLPIKDMKRMKIIKGDAKTMERFTEMSASIYRQVSLLIMKNQNLSKQRDLLLPRLMSGKLEV